VSDFAVEFTAAADPGGAYGACAERMAVLAPIEASLAAIGLAVGITAWGWL